MELRSAVLDDIARLTLLWVDTEQAIAPYADVLANQFHVSTRGGSRTAIEFLRRATTPPDFVVTDVGFPDGLGYEICRVAKELTVPSTVLVTASAAEQVPDALVAGCDSVLLKPFAPNLLMSRLARLKRARLTLRAMSEVALAKSHHLRERSHDVTSRIFREWPDSECPHCGHTRATCFEYSSHRRAWYACVACKKVWLSKRRE
jgi:DNA-binding response OmpR family regulator